jgi:hypothetical protein
MSPQKVILLDSRIKEENDNIEEENPGGIC